MGVLVFVLVFGVSTLDVTNDAFCRGGYIEKDIQQHYAGWLFYRQSSAGWPLCIARGINYPDGLSIAYTDSIPLLAALLKPVANLVGGTFQYMGWFTLVCFALQGGFGALQHQAGHQNAAKTALLLLLADNLLMVVPKENPNWCPYTRMLSDGVCRSQLACTYGQPYGEFAFSKLCFK